MTMIPLQCIIVYKYNYKKVTKPSMMVHTSPHWGEAGPPAWATQSNSVRKNEKRK